MKVYATCWNTWVQPEQSAPNPAPETHKRAPVEQKPQPPIHPRANEGLQNMRQLPRKGGLKEGMKQGQQHLLRRCEEHLEGDISEHVTQACTESRRQKNEHRQARAISLLFITGAQGRNTQSSAGIQGILWGFQLKRCLRMASREARTTTSHLRKVYLFGIDYCHDSADVLITFLMARR